MPPRETATRFVVVAFLLMQDARCRNIDLKIADREYWFVSMPFSKPASFSRPMSFSKQCLSAAALAGLVALAGCKTSGTGVAADAASASVSPAASSAPFIAALQGGIVARSGIELNKSDRQRALEAEYRALEAARGGQPVAWSGRGVSGEVVAAAPYQVGSQNCRQYTHTLTLEGNKQAVARGAACRNPNGSWSPLT